MIWFCLGFLSKLVPTSTSLAWSLTESSPLKIMCVVVFLVSLRELVFLGWWNVYLWTPLLIYCYFAFVTHSLSIVRRCVGQLLNAIFSFLRTRCIQWPSFVLIRVSCRCVIDVLLLSFVCRTRLMRTLISVYSASLHLLLLEFDIPEQWPPVKNYRLGVGVLMRYITTSLHCTVLTTLYSLHCTHYSVLTTVYSLHCTHYTALCLLHCIHYTEPPQLHCTIVTTLHSLHCTVLTTLHCTHHNALYSLHCTVLTTLHCTHYTALCSLHCTTTIPLHCTHFTVCSDPHLIKKAKILSRDINERIFWIILTF